MTPQLATRVATRLHPHRWWVLAVALAGTALLFATLDRASTGAATVAGALAGPIIFVPWALLCACIWFHPEQGKLRPGSRLIGKLPNVVQGFIRWYAALFLDLFVLVGIVVWPTLLFAWF